MTFRGMATLLLLAPFVACRCGPAPAPRSDPPDARDGDASGRVDLGVVSLVAPAAWGRVDVATLPATPGISTLACFVGSTGQTRGGASVALVPHDTPWADFTGESNVFTEAEHWTLADASTAHALLVANVPEPWTRRERLRWFVVGDAVVMFACEVVDEKQQALCDAQLERLRLTQLDAGSPFRFATPDGWTREPIPPGAWPGEMFTLEDQPGPRVTVASSPRCGKKKGTACEPARATLDRVLAGTRRSPDAGALESEHPLTHDGFPGLEAMLVRQRGQTQLAMQLWRYVTPKGDVVLACGGQRSPDLEAACETTRASVRLPSAISSDR